MNIKELLELAWEIYEAVEFGEDMMLDDLLDGVERDHGKATRDKIQYLLEVECNVKDM